MRRRLDTLLVDRGHYATRARARDAIRRGTIEIDGRVASKPGETTSEDARIAVLDRGRNYVSRGALKLLHGLDHFAFSPANLHALDIGASTGGFTQALLERGASHVTAIDVGRGQLADALKHGPCVTSLEQLDARELERRHVKEPVQFITADVSFISLKLALPKALALAAPGARLLALIKPQFEAGRAAPVNDPAVQAKVCDEIAQWLGARGWRIAGITASPIAGGEGNREFLIGAVKP